MYYHLCVFIVLMHVKNSSSSIVICGGLSALTSAYLLKIHNIWPYFIQAYGTRTLKLSKTIISSHFYMSLWQVQNSPDCLLELCQQIICSSKKFGKIFRNMPNIFIKVDDVLIVGYDDARRDQNRTLRQVMQICHWEILKLNKNKCHFRCTKEPFFEKVISREGVHPNPKKLYMITEMFPNNKKELQSFLSIITYPRNIFAKTAKLCKPFAEGDVIEIWVGLEWHI